MKVAAGLLVVASGSATLVQGFQLIMWAIWGRPTSPLQWVALIGSLVQVVGGVMLMVTKKATIAVVGLILTWLFWAPALFTTLRALSHIRVKPAGTIPSILLLLATLGVALVATTRRVSAEPEP